MQTRSQYLILTDMLGDNGFAKTCHCYVIRTWSDLYSTTGLHPFLLEFFVFIKTITFPELLLLSYFSKCIWNIVDMFAVHPGF